VAVDGRAWHTAGDGSVIIQPELIYTVEVTVADRSDCPLAPVVDGVPLAFFYRLD
jgi:hypothetical protein